MSAFEITALIKAQRKLWSGDIIGLQVDGLGLLAAPYFNGEPIPEFNESVSHLRISSGKKFSTADYRRCMFRVENDVGLKSPIVFGSVVRLSHYPSHLLLSAGAGIEDLEYEEPLTLRGVQLLSADSLNSDDLAHKWIIYPRYQLRDEGDPINRNDYVTIRNVKYKDLHLTSFVNPNHNPIQNRRFEDFVGLGPQLYTQYKPGMQVLIFRKCPPTLESADDAADGGGVKKKSAAAARRGKSKKKKPQQEKSEEEKELEKLQRSTVFSGDYVRLLHREQGGHIICRPDDGEAYLSVVTPLGSIMRKRNMMNQHNTHGIFVRSQLAQHPLEPHDFPCTLSSLGIWQVLMSEAQSPTEDAALHGMLQFTGKSIRLRHAVTGLFLSVRPAQEEDTATLKMNSSRTVMRLKAERKQKDLLTLQGEGRGSNSALANSPSGQKRRATAASMIEEERDFVANAVSSASGFDLLAESKNEQDMPETFDVLESASSASANEEERAAASRRPSAASLAEGEGGKLECHDISNDNDNNNSQYAGGVVAGRKGSTIQILHFADDSATGPDKVTIFIRSIYVAGMKNVNWAGKHFSGVHLRFGAKELCSDRDWQYRTVVSDRAGNTARWDMHKADRSVQFLVAEDECSHNVMEVKVNRVSNSSGELPMSRGYLQLPQELWALPDGACFSCSVQAFDFKEGAASGEVTLVLCKNMTITREDEDEFERVQRIKAEELEDENRELDFGDELSDEDEKERESALREVDWVVGTSARPDKFTRFKLVEIDASDDDNAVVNYGERLILVHEYTRRHLSLNTLTLHSKKETYSSQNDHGVHSRSSHQMHKQTDWWQYRSDIPLTPSAVEDDSILDSDVCQFDRVDIGEVVDLFYCSRYISVARTCTSALQLTPAVTSLYFPMFRHFSVALSTLTLWTTGAVDSEARLCPSENHPHLLYGRSKQSSALPGHDPHMPRIEEEGGSLEAKMDEDEAEVSDADSTSEVLHSTVRRARSESHQSVDGDSEGSDSQHKRFGNTNHNSSSYLTASKKAAGHISSGSILDDPRVWSHSQSVVNMSVPDTAAPVFLQPLSPRTSSIRAAVDDEHIAELEEQLYRSSASSLAPFLGRPLILGTAFWPEAQQKASTALNAFVQETLSGMAEKDSPTYQTIVRRQSIIAESGFLESCLLFLDVAFTLDRSMLLSRGSGTSTSPCKELPQFLLNCCLAIQKFLRAVIYKNEKIALGVLAIHGSFLSMISQKINGWDPPLEMMLRLTCRDTGTGQGASTAAPPLHDGLEAAMAAALKAAAVSGEKMKSSSFSLQINSAVASVPAGSNTNTNSNSDSDSSSLRQGRERHDPDNKTNSGPSESKKESLHTSISIERILADSISASDILQVVQQMHGLHQQGDPTALQILNMLIMLCRSGRARKHFQNLLVRAIIRNDATEYCLWGPVSMEPRPSSMQSNCALFYSRFSSNQWQVKFSYPFSFPSQEEKNQATLHIRLNVEAACLRKVFYQYNDDDEADDNVLDLSESFRLLEDLGLAGPSLYSELSQLEGASILGFLEWYAHRFPFYCPTSANSYCQLSPYQTLKQLNMNLLEEAVSIEMQRRTMCESDIKDGINYREVLNSRFESFYLHFQDDDYFCGAPARSIPSFDSKRSDSKVVSFANMRRRLMQKRFSFEQQFSCSQRGIAPGLVGIRDRSKREGRWFEFSQALEDDCEECAWFQRSLLLLGELCKSGNSYSQRLVTVLLPAEFLMAALQTPQMKFENRAIMLRLLSQIYVHHDFVYPMRLLPQFSRVNYCGHNEEIYSPSVATGLVFNAHSRVVFRGDGAEEGAHLRRLLFQLLTRSLASLKFFSKSREEAHFKEELLNLISLLFSRGFFQDPDFHFFQAVDAEVNTDVRMEGSRSALDQLKEALGLGAANSQPEHAQPVSPEKGSAQRSLSVLPMSSGAPAGEVPPLTIDGLQRQLIKKTNELILVQQCTRDFSVSYLPEHEDDALPFQGSLRSASRRSRSRGPKQRVVVSREKARSLAARRRAFNKVRDSFYYFDCHFSDMRNSCIIHIVIKLLTQIHEAKQLIRVQKTWNFVNNAIDAVAERSYSKNIEDLKQYLPRVRFDRFIQSAFEVHRHHEAAPGYTQALFYSSLFENFDLRKDCFGLMNRQLCVVRDAYKVYSSLVLLPDAHEAFLYRTIAIYADQLLISSRKALERPFFVNGSLLEKINFAVENIRAFCFSSSLDRLNRKTRRPLISDAPADCCTSATALMKSMDGSTARRAPRVSMYSGREVAPIVYKPEQDCFNYLMKPIPCPAGADDFFELDLDDLIDDSQRLADLCSYYDVAVQEIGELATKRPKIDCERALGAVSLNLLTQLLRHLKAPFFLAWEALYSSEKFVFEQIVDLLSCVGWNQSSLCQRWYAVFAEALLWYFPKSKAAGAMVDLLLRFCGDVAFHRPNSFAEKILKSIETHNLLQATVYPKMISSLLANPNRRAVELAAKHLLNRIHIYAAHFDFRMLPEQLCADQKLKEQFCLLLRPIKTMLSMKVKLDISPSLMAAIRVVFSADFCMKYLSSSAVPLSLKADLVTLSSSLFVGVRHNDAAGATLATGPETAVPVEDFVLSELRGMRSIFRLDVDVDFEGCSAYCIDFICRAAMARVREQLMRAAVLSVAKVNGHVYLAISSAVWTGGIPNRSVAHFEAEKMRQEFAVAYPSGLMDGGGNPKDTSAVADSAAKSVINTSDLLIDGSPSPIPAGQEGVVAYSVFQIALLVLNILGERDGLLMSRLNDAQRFDIIWISAAVDLMIDRHPQHISNPKGGVGAQEFHFRGVKDRLVEVYHGMIVEMLAKRTESNIRRFCATALTKKAWEQFCEVSMASPQQASATLLSRAGGGSGSEAQLERSRFSGSMSIAVEYPIEYLMASPPARFLKETLQDGADFLDKNGILLFGDFRSPVIKSAAFVRKFSSFTDFDLWMKGSGRYLQSVMSYLEKVTDPDASEYNFLHLLTGLLQHNIEEIRESRLLSLNVRIALLERETARLRRLQLAMKDLGALKLITQLVGNCNHHASEAFVWNYAPLALSLANGIISWQNTECQELIIESIETGIRLQKPPEMNCLVGLQFMIRKCALVLSQTGSENVTDDESDAGMGDDGHEMISESAAVCGRFPQGEQTRILRSVKQLFLFVGSFCKGDNAAAQSFFSAQEDTSRLYVDVIQELSQLANAVLTKFATTLEYIRYDEFYDRLGPLIWDQKDANRRRMFAWHNPKNNIALLTQYLFTISNMFDSMLSLCNHQTVVSIQQAIVKCPEVLEFTGLMQMVAVSHVPSVNAVGLEVQRAVYWHCGEPIKFYRTYFHELALMEMVEEDPDTEMICEAVERWHRGKANRTARVFRQRAFRDRDFRPIFGVSFELFMEQVKKAEGRCLSVILAFFSFGAPQNIADMSSKFDDGILTAQLNNSFQSISKGSGKSDLTSATAVSYLSILERIGVQFPETRELLNGWETKMMRRGMDPKRVFGAVEIINKQGKIQRLYFPIPQFVLMYWPYPEVQKMKDKIVLQVSRASPEEKLADFRQWMDRIIKVMKRQELLRTWLTFPVHMIFGGKSLGYLRYLPSKRMWALLLTLLFNCYYVYFTSLPSRFDPPHGSIANYLVSDMNNSIRMGRIPNPLEFLKVVLLALHFTMFLSKMLNSYVLIDLFERFESKTIWVDVLLKLAVLPYAIFLLLVDAGWELILVCLSFVGAYFDLYWFYAPMLLDVAFQVRFMRFLFDAVALNGSKITYTMLLAFLILYFYAVIATLYFNGQYDLDGHFGCSNVVSCFKLHLDYGIDNVPNWAGDFYIDPDLPLSFLYGPLLSRILGTVYSLSYVLLINLVLTSIISGLIIDTFGQLREENEFIQQDITDKCFICSIPRDDFEQEGIQFRTHTKEEHNMWHYVWFKIYLDSKDPLSYTSAEIYSADSFQDKTSFLQFMPVKKSLSIDQKSGEEVGDEQLEETLEGILDLLNHTRYQQTDLAKAIKLLRKASARVEDKLTVRTSSS